MTDKGKIVIFGSIVQDLVSYTKQFPRPGESVRGSLFQAAPGGKGANQAVAAAKLGANVAMLGRVGDDMFGATSLDLLKLNGVEVTGVEKSKTAMTATATITVNEQGENSIVVTLGANMELDAAAAERAESQIASATMVICQGEIPEDGNRKAFELARKHGVQTFFNPAPGDPNLDKSVLKLVDIVCTNENEAEFITGIPQNNIDDAKKAALQMLEMGPHNVIVTLGSKGCLLATKDAGVDHFTVEKVCAIDTTGAGDCFVGSLTALLIKGVDLQRAARTAARIAALSVTRKGTQSSYWPLEEIQEQHPDILKGIF